MQKVLLIVYFAGHIMNKKILITGGPGTGKTELIKGLENLGFNCEKEISREITENEQKKGVEQFFLKDPIEFSKRLMILRSNQYKKIQNAEFTFFDRGVHEIIAYLNFIKIKYDNFFIERAKEIVYNKIFILPPWKNIYVNDKQRYESFEQCKQIHSEIVKIYREFETEIIMLEKNSVNQRISSILKLLKE